MRYFIFLSFKGTIYHGWQRQPGSVTVQQVLEEKLSLKIGTNTSLTGAGRTDTGVHASYYCAHFDTEREDLGSDKDFIFGLNSFLPHDIAVDRIVPVHHDASARFNAISRTYLYRICRQKTPFLNEMGWYLTGDMNIELMNEAAKALPQFNDFACFCRSNSDVRTTICKITEASWSERNSILEFRITANRFLRNMVRAITGTMVDIGQGKTTLSEFRSIIQSGDRTRAGQSAPAQGLFLEYIAYPDSIFLT